MGFFSNKYRDIPSFKGKKRLGRFLFKKTIYQQKDMVVRCKRGLIFHILNTYDSVGRDLFFEGVYEPRTVSLIKNLLKDGDVFVDAGANIGAISLPVAKSKEVEVYAFEPGRNIYKVLEKNIVMNSLANVHPVHTALSDSGGEIDFYESDRVHGWSGPVKIDSFHHYKVRATTLDAFAADKGIDKIAVLKADVQGWEYHVFRGAERLIAGGRIPNIIFEFEWWAEKNAGLEIGSAQRFLLEKGYRLSTLNGEAITDPLTEGTVMIRAEWGR